MSHTPTDMRGRFTTAAQARQFLLAGHATITLVSQKTGTRFTYQVNANHDGSCHFVKVLIGPDNTEDYRYLGRIANATRLWIGRRVPKPGDITAEAPSARAFTWFWNQLADNFLPDAIEVWHEGTCGRCGRRLTVPESIAAGFGPECKTKV